VDVTPCPALARFERRDDWVAHFVEMFGRVPARRAVTTADMTASQAEAQMNPGRSRLQALCAAQRLGRKRLNINDMFTSHDDLPQKVLSSVDSISTIPGRFVYSTGKARGAWAARKGFIDLQASFITYYEIKS
jgi:hypothetical protein